MKVYVKIYHPDNFDEPIQISGVTAVQPTCDFEEFELEDYDE